MIYNNNTKKRVTVTQYFISSSSSVLFIAFNMFCITKTWMNNSMWTRAAQQSNLKNFTSQMTLWQCSIKTNTYMYYVYVCIGFWYLRTRSNKKHTLHFKYVQIQIHVDGWYLRTRSNKNPRPSPLRAFCDLSADRKDFITRAIQTHLLY